MSRLFSVLALLVLVTTSCGKSKSSPTAPPAPDNPNPPTITCSVSWVPSPSTIVLTVPAEDFVVTLLWVSVSKPNVGGAQLLTDLPAGTTLLKGVATTAHVTTNAGTGAPYVWQAGDGHVIQVRGHRPGQTKAFSVEVYRH